MFKSVFSKYVSAFMIIIILSFTVVALTTVSAVGNYALEAKKDGMANCTDAARAYMTSMMKNGDGATLDDIVFENAEDIKYTLERIQFNLDDLVTLIFDENGNLLVRAGTDKVASRINLSANLMEKLSQTKSIQGLDEGDEKSLSAELACGVALRNESDAIEGFLVICSSSEMIGDMVNMMVKMVLGSVLWVLLAALIAAYFISERVVAPLREISGAAKKFAAGRFDVRVPVKGRDEIAELAEAFNHMAESLDHYDDMRNSFMSDVAHDLRSPMTSISGFIDGILDGVIPREQHTYYLQVVSSEVKRLSRLVNTLLDLSKIQAGERKFTSVHFDVCETARQILISFEQKIDAKHIEVEFECDEDRMVAIADHDAIYQVIYNLCDNAVKFSEEGAKFAIRIRYAKGKKIFVEVFNEGQGISPNDIHFVFERFYKSDKSRGLNKNGAGLGLFISKTIIDAHDEQIWVESEYGKNCCFGFSLESE